MGRGKFEKFNDPDEAIMYAKENDFHDIIWIRYHPFDETMSPYSVKVVL